MAFKLAKNPTFKTRVDVDTPNNRGGHDRSHFFAEFFRTTNDELEELRQLPQIEVMKRKLAGWDEFLDGENNPVEFNEENMDALLNIPEALFGLMQSFWTSVIKAREQNLKR